MRREEELGSFWQDLKDACPALPINQTIVLKAISFLASVSVFVWLPALRVENGSADSCDPVRTYGEITEEGMRTVMEALSAKGGEEVAAEETFLDIGSGHGAFPLYACQQGPFSRCVGIEVQRKRHEVATAVWQDADGNRTGVTLLHGDVQEHPEAFERVRLVYWNNLCFSTEAAKVIALHFAARAPAGAELWVLSPLPDGIAGLLWEQQDVQLRMGWRDEPYRPIKYVRGHSSPP